MSEVAMSIVGGVPGVRSLAKTGSTKLKGDITLTQGSNVTLTQSGQDISIASSVSSFSLPSAQTGSVSTGTSVISLFVQRNIAYVTNYGDDTLQSYDISNPATPVSLATVTTATEPHMVYVQGNYAYVASFNGKKLEVIDVSNPLSMSVVGSLTTNVTGIALYVQGRYAFLVGADNTFRVIDIAKPTAPVVVCSASISGVPNAIYVQGKYVFLIQETLDRLSIFDLSDVTSPSQTGVVNVGRSAPTDVTVQGRYAYVLTRAGQGLTIIDCKNPASPAVVGSISITGALPSAVAVEGRIACVTSFTANTIEFIDIADPTNPVSLGTVGTGSHPYDVQIQGQYAYVINYDGKTLQTFYLGGSFIQQLETGSLYAADLSVRSNFRAMDGDFLGGANVARSLSVGQNIAVTGDLAIKGIPYVWPTSPSTGFLKYASSNNSIASQVPDLGTSDVQGNLPVTNLASGAGASSSTFWRGDGTWVSAVTSVATGTGLTGGAITSTGTIAMATNTIDTLAGYDHSGVFSDVAIGTGLSLSSGTLSSTAASSGSSGAFQLSNGSGGFTTPTNSDLTWDDTNHTLILGNSGGSAGLGKLQFQNNSNGFTTTFDNAGASASVGYHWPAADGSSGYFLQTNGSGTMTWASVLSAIGTLPLANGGTGNSLSDPGANTILGWDDTDNTTQFFTIGTGLSYDHSSHTLSAPSALAIGATVASGTATYVLYNGASNVLAQSGNFVWDYSNNRLGILTASPAYPLDVNGNINTPGTSGNTYRWNAGASAVSSSNLALPISILVYGGTSALLGDPAAWALVNIAGTEYKMALYS